MKKVFNKRYVYVMFAFIILAVFAASFTFNFVKKAAKAYEINNENIIYLSEEQYTFTNSDAMPPAEFISFLRERIPIRPCTRSGNRPNFL